MYYKINDKKSQFLNISTLCIQDYLCKLHCDA